MTDKSDVAAAVAAGVLTEEQGDAFSAFVAERHALTASAAPANTETEGVRFARGFHDVFITLGVGALLVGVALAGDLFQSPLILSAVCLTLAWALAEFLTGRRKLVLPSILLAGAVGVSGALVSGLTAAVFLGDVDHATVPLIAAIGGWLSGLLFYVRFKLPFAMAVSVAGILAFGLALLASSAPDWFDENALLAFLAAGLVTFVIAMWQDVQDPLRQTLKADNAFWLHLMAAPLVVHALVGLVTGDMSTDAEAPGQDIVQSIVIIAVITALAIVALLIDRRAMLVAGLGTLGYAIWTIITAANLDVSLVMSLTLVLIGTAVLLLGTGWQRTRRVLLGLVPSNLARHLPPANIAGA